MSVWRGIVQKDISIVIQYLSVEDRLCVGSAVCDRSKGSSKFDIIYAVLKTTQGFCL